MAKSLCVHVKDVGSIPGQGTKILHVADHSQKINKQTNKKPYDLGSQCLYQST